jgi:subtilisin family serine protease
MRWFSLARGNSDGTLAYCDAMQRLRYVLALSLAFGLALAPTAGARPLDKLGGQLRDLARGTQAPARPAGPSVGPLPAIVHDGRVLVDVYVKGVVRERAAALRRLGMRVDAVSTRAPQRIVEGWLAVSALREVASLESTRAVLPVYDGILNTGGTLSQGDAAHRGPQARALGPTGGGMPVGIISDSINKVGSGVAGSQSTGDLPATVQILNDSQASGTDEGRAMAEIVFDTAPGIPKILFSRGTGGAPVRVASIDGLVAAGAKIIADDVTYLSEPFFQDGIIAQAADRAKANGRAYLVSAGNRARESWEGTFTPLGSPALNDFNTGAGTDTRQTVATVPNSQQLAIFVQWDDPFGAATSDFALDFYNANTSAFLGSVDSNNVASGIPAETAVLTGGGGSTTFAMAIRRVSGTGTPRLKWIANGSFTGSLPAEFATGSQAIDPDASSARGTLAVAAVRHNDVGLNSVESFSSRGPFVTRYLDKNGVRLATPDVRPKPDIAGADGVATSVTGFTSFFGTSAAAPSAAGVAALVWSAKPSLTVDQLYAIMRDPRGTIDCTAAGQPDADCGWGFLLADGKVSMALDSSPPAVAAALSPGAPDGSNGWFHGTVGLSWNVSDPQSPVSTSGCAPQTVATDGIVASTCTATSAGGTTNQPVTIKRDTQPPSPPTFTGIKAGAKYTRRTIPPRSRIRCQATDATSGVTSCVVRGYSSAPGRHTLTAIATDESGLISNSRLTYTVKPDAARRLRISRGQTIGSVLSSGLRCSLIVARRRTSLNATLRVGTTVVGQLRTRKNRGKRILTVPLNGTGRALLSGRSSAKFKLTVSARSRTAAAVKLRARRTLSR